MTEAEIRNTYAECQTANWDGYGAHPLSENTLRMGIAFFQTIPPKLAPLSVGAEPDGSLTFEWRRDATHVLSVSVRDGNNLAYAGIIGGEKHHGNAIFSTEFPLILGRMIGVIQGKGD